MNPRSKVSVVIPIHNEEDNIPILCERLYAALERLGRPYEVIFVDDGSRDGSAALLIAEAARHPGRVRAVELSRNFGQHPAIMAGFRHVTGDVAVTMDADLQNPPEEIARLLERIDAGYDVVGGVRRKRKDSIFRRALSAASTRVSRRITGIRLSDFGCMLRAYSREVVDEINRCEESSTFIPALAMSFARHPVEVEVEHAPRTRGDSKYSSYRLLRLNFDLMTGFSAVPLQIFAMLGLVVSAGGLALGAYLLVRRFILLRHSEAEGLFTLFAIAFVIMGAIMAGLGIMGEYVGRIYTEVRGRPRFLIRAVHGTTEEHEEVATVADKDPRPRIVVFAYSDVGHAGLRRLIEAGRRVVAVYTHADAPGEKVWFPSVADLARSHGIEVREDADLRTAVEVERFRELRPDLVLSMYYRRLLPEIVLKLPRLGAFNMHGSLLPRYRGRAPVNWAVLNGETETGATLHVMEAKADAGDIVDQEPVPIGPDDTALQVQERITAAAVTILARQIRNLESGRAPRRAQDESQATTFGRRRPEDGEIDWSRPAREVHNLVRAVTHPYPGAFTNSFGTRIFVWSTRPAGAAPAGLRPGQTYTADGHDCVACGDGDGVAVLKAQVDGGGEEDAIRLLRGATAASSRDSIRKRGTA